MRRWTVRLGDLRGRLLVVLLGGALLISSSVVRAQSLAEAKLSARVFMAAFGKFEPLALRTPEEPRTQASYLQFALDPGIPAGILLDLELPASAEERQVRVSVTEGKRHPKVRWVSVPPALGLDKPKTVHVPVWLDALSFCADVQIEISASGQRAPMLRRVVGFECGE